jgi:NADH oxidase (H2O2-forming)
MGYLEGITKVEERDVVIIGGGPAGRTIVHVLHAAGKDLSVTVIKDEAVNVNRCAVPYGIDGKKPIEKFQISNKLVTDYGAELVVDRVATIDTVLNQVHTEGGQTFHYRHLVLATGSRPLVPPIPGVDAKAITPVRSLADLAKLRDLASKGKKAVVIGGGYIGLEVAVVLDQMGMDVTVVEMLPKILMATTEPEFIDQVETLLQEKGVQLMTGEKVVKFEKGASETVEVKLESGKSLPADLVIMSAGVILNTELPAQAGIQASNLGIGVDATMRTNIDNIYACGDCAQKVSFVTGEPIRGEFGTNAVFMAKVVAQNILGGEVEFPGALNANTTAVYDMSLGSAGLTERMARDAGIKVLTGTSEVLDKYPMMDGVRKIRTKLIFNRDNNKLIGGSVLCQGEATAARVDFISFAIQMGATANDLLAYQYCTHPELAAKPSDNSYVFAAKDALGKI